MKAVIQRVIRASVIVDGEVVGKIGEGLVILLGVRVSDSVEECDYLADKIVNLRIFNDDNDKMNLSLLDSGGSALVISQFTIHSDVRKGRRPGFSDAAHPDTAIPLYERFIANLKEIGIDVQQGIFGAMMQVELINDGPVTLIVSSKGEFEQSRLD